MISNGKDPDYAKLIDMPFGVKNGSAVFLPTQNCMMIVAGNDPLIEKSKGRACWTTSREGDRWRMLPNGSNKTTKSNILRHFEKKTHRKLIVSVFL